MAAEEAWRGGAGAGAAAAAAAAVVEEGPASLPISALPLSPSLTGKLKDKE